MKKSAARKNDNITIDGASITYMVAGSGKETILCIHGLGASTRYFVPLIDELSSRYRTYSLDQPDFGKSENTSQMLDIPTLASYYETFIKKMKLKNCIIVANSMGCQVAVELAVRPGSDIRALALIGPTVNPKERSTLKQLWRWLQDSKHEPEGGTELLKQDYKDAGLFRLVRTLRHTIKDKIEEKLPFVRQPTLIIRGDKDTICPQDWAEEMVDLLPDGTLEIVRNAGHAAHLGQPKQTASLIRSFLSPQ